MIKETTQRTVQLEKEGIKINFHYKNNVINYMSLTGDEVRYYRIENEQEIDNIIEILQEAKQRL